jgi:hypothetical protein
MLPRQLPPGTTLRSLVTELLPDDHRKNVPADAGEARVGVRFGGGSCYLLVASGSQLTVTETPRIEPAPLLLSVEETTAQLFLDDYLGPQTLVASFEPRGIASITDPRFLRAVSAVAGVVSMSLHGFRGVTATVLLATGPDASLYDDPDVTLDIDLPAFLPILAGKVGPDEAIAEGHARLKGKKLLAMQLALTLVPYFPPRPATRR